MGLEERGGEGTGSDGSTTQKHHTVTAGLYTQASQLTLWDWKSEGGEVTPTAKELAVTAALHRSITVIAGIYVQASPLTLWDWKSEGARESDSEGTASDGSTTQKHHTVTAGIYIQASPLTLWDWKSEGARESDSEGTGSDGSTTQKHYSDSRNIHISITTHTVGLEERGGRGNPTARELPVTAALHRSITVTAGIYIQASPLTLWDWKSEGAR